MIQKVLSSKRSCCQKKGSLGIDKSRNEMLILFRGEWQKLVMGVPVCVIAMCISDFVLSSFMCMVLFPR